MKQKYILPNIIIALLFTRCGGGGGGSGSSGANFNVNPPNKTINPPVNASPKKDNPLSMVIDKDKKLENPIFSVDSNNSYNSLNGYNNGVVKPKEETNNKEIISPKVNFGSSLPENFNYETPKIPETELHEEELTVGILDSDFIQNKEKLKEKYKDVNLNVLDKDGHNYTQHGEIVLNDLLKGIKPHVVAASLSKKDGNQNTINFSLDDYKKILEEMKKRDKNGEKKLKVFNQSWGSSVNYNEEEELYKTRSHYKQYLLSSISEKRLGDFHKEILVSGQKSLDFYDEAVNKENALFIWANGNYDANDNTLRHAGIQAAAPFAVSSLEKGWISVVGVDGDNKNNHYAKHLAYAGVARNWSIAASGESDISYTFGSSYAAPKVSNAAVKVGSKFRWMTNNDVRLTLFTTTNKLGTGDSLDEENRYLKNEAEFDSGWGVLNTARALKGPGAFWEAILKADGRNYDSEDYNWYFNARIPENTTTFFENHIYGDAGLRKTGKGTLVLTEKYDSWDPTKLIEGTLEIYKTHSPGMEIRKDGTLVLHNDSLVGYYVPDIGDVGPRPLPVTNKGTITLTGKTAYIGSLENKDGVLNIKEGSCLNILSKGNLNNLTLNIQGNNYASLKGKKENVIKGSDLSGNIKEVNIDGMKKVKLEENSKEVTALISRTNALDYLGNSEKGSMESMERIEESLKELDAKFDSGKISEKELKLGSSITSLSKDKAKKVALVASGEIYASAQALTFLESQSANRALSNHLMSLKDFKDSNYEWQSWVSFYNSKGKLEKSGYASAKTKINGGEFGVDKKFDDTLLGVAFSFSNGSGDFDKFAGKYSNKSVGISLYGKKYFNDGIYALGKVGVTSFDTKVERNLFTMDGDIKNGKIEHTDEMVSTYLEIGKHFDYITPFIGYSADYLRRDSFKEDSSWGIEADRKGYLKQNLVFGISSEYKLKSDIKLFADITHQLNIGDRGLDFTGKFVDGNRKFNFKGVDLNKNTSWIGAGISKNISDNLLLDFKVDLRIEKKFAERIYSAGMTYRF